MKYDLVIAYRIYPGISKIPPVFSKDKFKLSKLCFDSFINALEGINYKIYVILDNCPEKYDGIFTSKVSEENLELIRVNGLGNKGTFEKQIEILLNQNESEMIYFAEDDYYYIDKIKDMSWLIQNKKADFVSPYEHPSCYVDNHVIKNDLYILNNKKYISVQHACITFMTTKKNLGANKNIFLIYSKYIGSDFVFWGCITLGRSFFKYIKLLTNFKNYTTENLKVFGSMLFFGWYRFITNKKFTLKMPSPTIATHMESDFMSPNIDWNAVFKKYDK